MSDFDRAALLLHICDLSRQWPNLARLHGRCMQELEQISRDMTDLEPSKTVDNRGAIVPKAIPADTTVFTSDPVERKI